MSTEPFEDLKPEAHPTAYVHASAVLMGDVTLAEDSSIWPTTVLRGDNGAIAIGARSNVQDGSVVHATLGISTTTVGAQVTIGHRVVLHGCTIGDDCLIGMGSIILDGAEIGPGSFVAAGSLVTPNKKFPPNSFILGSPAKRMRDVNEVETMQISHSWQVYQQLAKTYRGVKK